MGARTEPDGTAAEAELAPVVVAPTVPTAARAIATRRTGSHVRAGLGVLVLVGV
jgi:hypothetical protein